MVAAVRPDRTQVLGILEDVLDPEVPVLNVVEMGIVRDVEVTDGGTCVVITPTYSGCPAMNVIADGIVAALRNAHVDNPTTRTVLAPPWTSDWITDEAREKLRRYGIAPPERGRTLEDGSACPFCASEDTELRSAFGSTACKALFYCNACQQPFEHFKCV